MKYMSFNSSCAYTGLANLLALEGIDAEDREIALEIQLPCMFARERDVYCAGPMLQGKQWFDLYLKPRGYELIEEIIPRNALPDALASCVPAMLGILVSPQSKHAVICSGVTDDTYHFINNRHPLADEPDTLQLNRAELLARTDDQVHVATLKRTIPTAVSFKPLLEQSIVTLREYRQEMQTLLPQHCSRERLLSLMNTHFRALLLDALTMMQLIQQESLVQQLSTLQRNLLQAVRNDFTGTLADVLPPAALMDALDTYTSFINEKALSY